MDAFELISLGRRSSPQLASGWSEASAVAGGAERESYAQILDILLGITVALLAVAVLVALVGVANTLSLGVVERTGENALLRALGTTRRQMRAMLGWEGVLLAAVGAVLGLLIGSLYGVLGIIALLGSTFPVSITIPWGQLGLVLVLAILSGALASVLPGRAAARPPATALGRTLTSAAARTEPPPQRRTTPSTRRQPSTHRPHSALDGYESAAPRTGPRAPDEERRSGSGPAGLSPGARAAAWSAPAGRGPRRSRSRGPARSRPARPCRS